MLSELAAFVRRWPVHTTAFLVMLVLATVGVTAAQKYDHNLLETRLSSTDERLSTVQRSNDEAEQRLEDLKTANATLQKQVVKLTADLSGANKENLALEAEKTAAEDARRVAELKVASYEKGSTSEAGKKAQSQPSATAPPIATAKQATPAENLATIETHGNPSEVVVAAFQRKLTQLDAVCVENEEKIADMLVFIRDDLRKSGIEQSLSELADGLAASIYSNNTQCASNLAMIAILLKASF